MDPDPRRLFNVRVYPFVRERVDVLAEKANEGTLNSGERVEYERLINAADLISLLNLKARSNSGGNC